MKFSRLILIVLASAISMLMISQTAAAGGGKGPKSDPAGLAIDGILLINEMNGDTVAEISGGGFLNGDAPSVTLDDGTVLAVDEVSATMILATISKQTADGDYLVTVTTGDQNKQTASFAISLGGEMIVNCVVWFRSGPNDEHVHTEIHVVDGDGIGVVGAIVTWTAENDTVGVYQTNVSPTNDNDGHAAGVGCPADVVVESGVTDWFCCIGAGKFDGGIPGKRACDEGFYTANILDVTAPPATNMVWDGTYPENEIELLPKAQ